MRKRSKYRPRRVLLDTMAFVQGSLTPVAKHDNYLLDLKIVNSMPMASGLTERLSHCIGKVTIADGKAQMIAAVRRDVF